MALETVTHISDLVAANPTPSDPKSAGDDHLRNIKTALKTDLPNISGAMNASHTELNYMVGATTQPAMKDGSNLTTPTLGDSTTKIATTAFVTGTAFVGSLPAQTGNSGKFVTTNGSVASWALPIAAQTGNSGKYLTTDGANSSWAAPFPAQAGNAGKYLSTDGTSPNWTTPAMVLLATINPTVAANVDALSVFSSAYDNYLITIAGILPSANDTLRIQFANSGTVDSGLNYFNPYTSASTVTTTTSADTTLSVTSTGHGGNLVMRVLNVNDAVNDKFSDAIGASENTTPAGSTRAYAGYIVYRKAAIASGIRFFWLSGANFTATGKIRIYGYANP